MVRPAPEGRSTTAAKTASQSRVSEDIGRLHVRAPSRDEEPDGASVGFCAREVRMTSAWAGWPEARPPGPDLAARSGIRGFEVRVGGSGGVGFYSYTVQYGERECTHAPVA